jgi:hypothetical protein
MQYYKNLDKFSFNVLNVNGRSIKVEFSNGVLKYNNVEQTNDLDKEFDKLIRNNFFLEIETLEQYKAFLRVDIGRHRGIADEIRKHFNKKWKFQKDVSIKEFLGIIKVNFPEKYEYFEILLRVPLDPTLDEFYAFIKEQIRLSRHDFDDLYLTERGSENITRDIVKIWIGNYLVKEVNELVIKLTNWVVQDKYAILISGDGYGLFTSKNIKKGEIICEFGGNIMSEVQEGGYVLAIAGGPFYGWNIDAKSNFRIQDIGRYANNGKDAQFEISYAHDLPVARIVATKDIPSYSEIYVSYYAEIPEEEVAIIPEETDKDFEEFQEFIVKYPKYSGFLKGYGILKDWKASKSRSRIDLDVEALAKSSYEAYKDISYSRWKTFWKNYNDRKLKKK